MYDQDQVILIIVATIYLVYGFGVSVFVYGRKTHHDAKMMQAKESFWVQPNRPGAGGKVEQGNYLVKSS